MITRWLLCGLCLLLSCAAPAAQIDELRAAVESSGGRERVDRLNELSKAYWGVSSEQTIAQADTALALARELDYPAGIATALRHKGIGFWYQDDYQAALDHVQQALQIFEGIGDDQGIAGCLSTIGTIYLNLERFDRALATYQEALALAEKIGDQNRIGILLSNIGTTYLGLEQPEQALPQFERALGILQAQGSQLDILTALGNIGGAQRRLKRFDEALAINARILDIARQIDSKVRVCDALTDTAQILLESGRRDDASAYLTQAIELARSADLKSKEMEAELQFARLHEAGGDFASALARFRRYDELRAEIFSAENARTIAELRTTFEADKKERELAARLLEIEVQRNSRNFFIAVSLLVLIVALANYGRFRAKRREAELLDRLSRTDPLTGLANRRSVLAALERERLGTTPFTVVLADVDHFKQINDRHGHDVGDLVLLEVSKAMQAAVRASDQVARWGGEEFLLLLPGCSGEPARAIAERARLEIAARTVKSGDAEVRVTATFGVSSCAPGEAVEACVKRADEALYLGKQQGRNRVVEANA